MILLQNGTFIDWRTLEFEWGDFFVETGYGGRVWPVMGSGDIEPSEVIDCKGMYITHAFANAHHHVYSALATGMPTPKAAPRNFTEILQKIWWNLDRQLDHDMIRSCAMVTAMACARAGVTFVIDHHSSPNAVSGSLNTIAEAFDEVGVGHLLCYEISDRDGAEVARSGLEETERYLGKHQGLVGMHASFTVGDETLTAAVALARSTGRGIHLHVAEDMADQDHCRRNYGLRVLERLDRWGVIAFPSTILAHGLYLDEKERALFSNSMAWVVQNMESNLNNQVGFFNSEGMGNRIMLGTDGMHSDMLRSARAAFFSGLGHDQITPASAYQRFRNVHHFLAENHFRGDGENNLVILDYPAPTPFLKENFSGHFLYGLTSEHVRHVISGGKVIVRDRNLVTVNSEEVLRDAVHQAERLWKRIKKS